MQKLISISRPRFWMYSLGTYLIGIGASQGFDPATTLNPLIWLWVVYFTFPANILIYGINDIGDMDTDAFNAKKGTYEAKIVKSERKVIIFTVVLTTLLFLPLAILSSKLELMCYGLLILFGLVYSLSPIRLKSIPFIDSLSNGAWCAMVGIMGYTAAGGVHIALIPCIAGGLWATVMHAYSAIPDIDADRKARVKTIATVLGAWKTLVFCLITYICMGMLLYFSGYVYHSFLVIPYIVLIFASFKKLKQTSSVFAIYKIYPYITYIVGPAIYALNVKFNS